MTTLKSGQRVEVRKIIWANGPGLDPTKAWVKGYTFEKAAKGVAVVKTVGGVFDGCLINYALEDVRAA